MKNRLSRWIILILILPILCGCSAVLAMKEKKKPNMTVCQIGYDRSTIEQQLGPPVSTSTLPDGHTEAIYGYEIGNTPSHGRAALHGILDVLTMGGWELLGTPLEWRKRDEKHFVKVVYDPQQNVVAITPAASAEFLYNKVNTNKTTLYHTTGGRG